MGMHTELILKCRLVDNLPENVDQVLNFLFNDQPLVLPYPQHDFFKCSHWEFIGNSASYYHVPVAIKYLDKGILFTRFDMKNYHTEIELFIDWLQPYIDAPAGKCIGWTFYEEYLTPILVYKT